MRSTIIFILLFVSFISNAQEYNTYFLKKEELKGKDKGKYYLKSNENIVGNLSGEKLISIYLWNSTYPPEYQKDEMVGVYIDKLDLAKANMPSLDTAGIIYNKYGNERVGFGKIHSFGNFNLPPVYTNFTLVNGNALYGQKLKNGNWKAASASYNTDTKKYVYIPFPENKDYTLLSPNLILFLNLNNKYGLMDGNGNILEEAQYDTCMTVFKYNSYNIKTKAIVQSESWIRDKPISLQKNFVTPNSYAAAPIIQYPDKLPVFLLKNKEYTILASAKYITKPIKNAVISSHILPGSNQSHFYFIRQNKQEYDIIFWYGEKPDPKFKYAYLETVKRDTTPGFDYNWNFSEKEDYTQPFIAYSVDSLNIAKYKKEYEDAQKLKAELAEHIKKVEASSSNYTTAMIGRYENIKWEEANQTYTGQGGYDELMSVRTEDLNLIRVSINFKARRSQVDPEIHTFDFIATLAIESTVLKGKGFGIDANDVNGYRLFQPNAKKDEKPDINQLKKENKQSDRQEILVKSISGTYNPITREIYIWAEKTFGGTITITAKKTQK